MRRHFRFLYVLTLFGVFSLAAGAAWANFFVVPVGGSKIDPSDVVELRGTASSADSNYSDVGQVDMNGAVGSTYTVPAGRLLVIASVMLCPTPETSAFDHDVYLAQQSGAVVNRAHWVFVPKGAVSYQMTPGLIIGPGQTVKVRGDSSNLNPVEVYIYGYLIDQ